MGFVDWFKQLIWDLSPNNDKKTNEFIAGAGELTAKFDKVIADMKAAQPLPEAKRLEVNHAYVYPDVDVPLLQAFDGKFEACYIILHPFYQWDENLPDEEFAQKAQPIKWQTIIDQTEFKDFVHLYLGLLDHFRAQQDDGIAYPDADMLLEYGKNIKDFNIPYDGEFDDLNQPKYMATLQAAYANGLVFVPEMPHDQVESIDWEIDDIEAFDKAKFSAWHWMVRSKFLQFDDLDFDDLPKVGSMIAGDLKLLYTVEWDSYFTLLYGEQAALEAMVKANDFEGFFAGKNTMHSWWL